MKKTKFYKKAAYLFTIKALDTYYPVTGKWLYEAFLNQELFIFEIKEQSALANKLLTIHNASSLSELAEQSPHLITIADRYFIYGEDKEDITQKLT